MTELASATIALESIPPLRKLPSGTSETICRRIARADFRLAAASAHSSSGSSSGANDTSQYCWMRSPSSRVRGEVAGRELVDALEDRVGIGNPEEGQVVGDRVAPQGRAGERLEERLDLGSEVERPVSLRVVERLDAEAVAREEELAALVVPDREREDPVQALEHLGAVARVHGEDDLGVAGRLEGEAVALELRLQLAGSCRARRCR